MLPRELLQQLRMEPPVKLKGQKRKRLNPIREEVEANVGDPTAGDGDTYHVKMYCVWLFRRFTVGALPIGTPLGSRS